MKKLLKAALAVLMVFMFALPAGAVDLTADSSSVAPGGIMRPMYVAISVLSAGLTINGAGLATCTGTVIPSNDSYISYLNVSLMKQNGSTWQQVTSWSGSAAGTIGVSITGYYYVTHGTYRTCSAAFIYSSGGVLLDSAIVNSSSQTY